MWPKPALGWSGNSAGSHPGGSCLRPPQLLLQKQMTALMENTRKPKRAQREGPGPGASVVSWGVVSAQWLGDGSSLECGRTPVGGAGELARQEAGTLAKGPKSQGH